MNDRRTQTRFQARTEMERAFLTPVNATYGEHAPLAGMTHAAIDAWCERASAAYPDRRVVAVAGVLREVATRAELLADDSRDVFDGMELTPPGTVEELRAMLVNAI